MITGDGLTRRERELLEALRSRRGEVVTPGELLDAMGSWGSERVVREYVARLRRKLGEGAVLTCWGRGYYVGRLPDAVPTLTPRQSDVVRLRLAGLQLDEIAERLGVSRGVVETHLKGVAERLGSARLYDLIAWALRHGRHLIPPDSRLGEALEGEG